MTIVFANPSVVNMLETWFGNKTEQAIAEIDEEINQEQIKQTERLKEALASEIIEVEAAFDRFVEEESQKRIAAIQAHADEKIAEISTLIDDEEKKSEIEAELEAIYQEAIQAIEAVDVE